jgi:hypothetical protein
MASLHLRMLGVYDKVYVTRFPAAPQAGLAIGMKCKKHKELHHSPSSSSRAQPITGIFPCPEPQKASAAAHPYAAVPTMSIVNCVNSLASSTTSPDDAAGPRR